MLLPVILMLKLKYHTSPLVLCVMRFQDPWTTFLYYLSCRTASSMTI